MLLLLLLLLSRTVFRCSIVVACMGFTKSV